MAKRRKFSAASKARLVLELLSGQRSAADIAREDHIKDNLLREWRTQFVERAPAIFSELGPNHEPEQKIAGLKQQSGQRTIENEVLKKPRAGSGGWRDAATDGEAIDQGVPREPDARPAVSWACRAARFTADRMRVPIRRGSIRPCNGKQVGRSIL